MRTMIEMAHEVYGEHVFWTEDQLLKLKAFAELVRADEREAIAQMIEDAPPLIEFAQNGKGGCMMCGYTPKLAAEVIRARGNT